MKANPGRLRGVFGADGPRPAWLRMVLCLAAACLAATAGTGQSDWVVRHQGGPGSGILWGIAPGPAGLVAVGTGGTVLQSLDGRTWTARVSGTEEWLLSCVYGNGKYVVVGDRGTLLTSPDAVSWTAHAAGLFPVRLNRVAYGGGRFVAVGEAETILASDDGEHWSLVHAGGAHWLRGLIWVQIGEAGAWLATGQNGIVFLSNDGTNWTASTGALGADLEAVCHVGAQFIHSKGYPVMAGWVYLLAGGAGETVRRLTLSASVSNGVVSLGDLTAEQPAPVLHGSGGRLRAVAPGSGADQFQLFGENGIVVDGVARINLPGSGWQERQLPVPLLAMDVAVQAGSRFVVGDDLRILQSAEPAPVRFANLSTRAEVRPGEQVMIAGAIVAGEGGRRVLVRALGPTLADFGLTHVLADPRIEVHQGERRVAEIGPWAEGPDAEAVREAMTRVGAPPLDPGRKDAAAVLELPPGATTLVVSSASQGSGVALVDVFDLDPAVAGGSRLFNLSTRGFAGPGEQTMIAGLIIEGTRAKTVLLRGLGAKLAEYGIAQPLSDPVLTLFQGDRALLTNDDWSAPQAQPSLFGGAVSEEELRTMMKALNLSSLDNYAGEAVLVTTLAPGAYTVHLAGKNGASGTALIEAFELPY